MQLVIAMNNNNQGYEYCIFAVQNGFLFNTSIQVAVKFSKHIYESYKIIYY